PLDQRVEQRLHLSFESLAMLGTLLVLGPAQPGNLLFELPLERRNLARILVLDLLQLALKPGLKRIAFGGALRGGVARAAFEAGRLRLAKLLCFGTRLRDQFIALARQPLQGAIESHLRRRLRRG